MKTTGIRVAFLFGFVVGLAVACGADLVAGKADSGIRIDGKLSENCWSAAPEAGSFQILKSRSEESPGAQTSFRILASGDAFYVGVRCEEPDMSALKRDAVDRDGPVFAQDVVELFFDPTGNATEYYQFAISANGDQWDQYFIEGGNTTIGPYSSLWDSAVFFGEDYWSLELRIPMMALFFTPSGAFSETWLLNVARERKPKRELSTWSPLVNGFHEPENFRRVSEMPKKLDHYDLAVSDVQAVIDREGGDGYGGNLVLRTSATQKTAGPYRLSVRSGEHTVLQDTAVQVPVGEQQSVAVPGVTFAQLSKQEVTLVLRTPEGDTRTSRFFPLRVRYEPVEFDVAEPFYRNCIFPGQTVDTFRGSVVLNLSAEQLTGAAVRLDLTGPGLSGGRHVGIRAAETVPFEFDIRSLQLGTAQLKATVIQKGKELVSGEMTLRKLGPAPGSMIYVDPHLRLVVDGKPTFVRGWYGPTWMVGWAFQEKYPDPKAKCSAYLQGKQIGVEPERIDKWARSLAVKDVRPGQNIFDEIAKRVEANRNDSDVWWYYLCDEPECRQISPVYLKYLYDHLKQLDPYRPVMIITRAPERYSECADILNPHPYLNPMINASGKRTMKSPKAIRDQIETVLSAGRGKILPMLTPQCFSYGFVNRFSVHPNFEEYRCMMWAGAASGAKGFTPFIYHGSLETPDLRLGGDFIYKSMAAVEDLLLAATPPEILTVIAPDNGVCARLIVHDGNMLLIVVNLLDQPASAELSSPSLRGEVLHRLRAAETVDVSSGKLSLSLHPYEVRVYTRSAFPGLETLAELHERIAAAEMDRCREGNLIFGRGRQIIFSSSSTYISMKSLQASLTDGMRDVLGWRHINGPTPAWIEMDLGEVAPEFSEVRIYGNRLGSMKLSVWKDDAWEPVWTAAADVGHEAIAKLAAPVHTQKLRLELPDSKRGHSDGGEVYEVELFAK